jgi:hypothetical protein
MVLADEIVQLLQQRPEGMSDGELSQATGTVHQRVNQCCRALANQGVLVREPVGWVIHNRLTGQAAPVPRPREEATAREWFWEGNVQAALCAWLASEGWALVQVMNTETRQQGTDIEATRGGVRLHVEVKGYPSEGASAPPSLRATHYYAGALLKAVRLREEHPDDDVAMAFPDKPRYRTLLAETARSVRTLRITVFFIAESGSVTQA